MIRIIFICSLFCLAFLAGCYYDTRENLYPSLDNSCNDTIDVTYSSKIVPILNSYCISCHSGSNPSGNINLTSYASVKAQVDNNNKLLSSIKQDGKASAMPKGGGKLDDCMIATFTKWINAGAPNN